jgi:ribosomal protein S18 acetylase RimI-like enzyme
MERTLEVPVRRAEAADARVVAQFLHDCNTEFSDPTPGVEAVTRRMAELLPTTEMIVLLGGGGPDGVAVTRLRPSLWSPSLDAYLEELYVARKKRGQGIGRALLEETMNAARAAGANHIELTTSEADTAAIALYESCGFTNREGTPSGPTMHYYERDL